MTRSFSRIPADPIGKLFPAEKLIHFLKWRVGQIGHPGHGSRVLEGLRYLGGGPAVLDFPLTEVRALPTFCDAVSNGVQNEMKSPFNATRWYARHLVCSSDLRVPGIEQEYPFDQRVEKGYVGHTPGLLYQSMVHGIVPLSMRGVVWYQGEAVALSNAAGDRCM